MKDRLLAWAIFTGAIAASIGLQAAIWRYGILPHQFFWMLWGFTAGTILTRWDMETTPVRTSRSTNAVAPPDR